MYIYLYIYILGNGYSNAEFHIFCVDGEWVGRNSLSFIYFKLKSWLLLRLGG